MEVRAAVGHPLGAHRARRRGGAVAAEEGHQCSEPKQQRDNGVHHQ